MKSVMDYYKQMLLEWHESEPAKARRHAQTIVLRTGLNRHQLNDVLKCLERTEESAQEISDSTDKHL